MNIELIRDGIPALSQTIYLNTGTFGPLPTAVAAEIRRAYGEIEKQGTFAPPIFWDMELAGFEAVRKQVARFQGADPDEIALTRNVTDGINIVLHGLDWRPGDEVILSDHEHAAGTVPWLALAERSGIHLRWLQLVADADEIVARFQRLVTPRTRLACLSHVSCLTGLRLPVERLCAAARSAGVISLIDGAHAEGQFAVDVKALGCDFYAACGHKWLLGPQGVGMLYVGRDWLDRLQPAWLGWGVNQGLNRQGGTYELEPAAARFEQSTRAWPLFLAFGQALTFIDEADPRAIEARVRMLRTEFVAGLQAIPGVTVHSPLDPRLGTGLVTAHIAGWEGESLSRYLWETRRIITTFNREYNALRFSLAFFNTREELKQVLEVLEEAGHSGQN